MEFIDLKKQYKVLYNEINKRVCEVLSNANYILGAEVAQLEKELAEYVGVRHCVTCANGTDALTLALKVLNIGTGDAVFVPSFTFFASAETIAMLGATPVFTDVREDTFNICVESLETEIKSVIKEGTIRPKAIMAVDLFGQCADYSKLEAIAKKYGLLIIEDGAQGFGGSINGKMACSFGDIATTSFFPAKPLGCYGDGGAVFTNNDRYADTLKSLRFHGKGSDKYDNIRLGYNSRLDTVQAAILLVKLKAFKDYELTQRNILAENYTRELKSKLNVPIVPEGFVSSWAQYTVKIDARDEFLQYLRDKGVPSMVYYPKGLHKQTALSEFPSHAARLPVTDKLCKTVLSLPMHPYMDEQDFRAC